MQLTPCAAKLNSVAYQRQSAPTVYPEVTGHGFDALSDPITELRYHLFGFCKGFKATTKSSA